VGVRVTGRKLLWVDLVVLEALAAAVTIFLTDASSPERWLVWAALVALPVLTFGALSARGTDRGHGARASSGAPHRGRG
jgi:hypothetical protein